MDVTSFDDISRSYILVFSYSYNIVIPIRKLEFMWLLYSGDVCGRVMELCVEINVRNVRNCITTFLLWNVLQQDGGFYLNN